MTFYVQDEFATNDVVGALAAAAVHDLHVNNFIFTGFPAIEVLQESREEGFRVRFTLRGHASQELAISFSEGKALASAFRAKKQVSQPWIRKVQGLITELEGATSP